jgi:hypothetical protein
MFLTKNVCTIYVRKVYKHDESWENTCLWEGERKYTRYTYRGIPLIKYNWTISDCKQCDLDLNAFNQSYSFS